MIRSPKKSDRSTAGEPDAAQEMRRRSRRSFLVLGLGAVAGIAGWEWLVTRPRIGDTPYPLRWALEFNEAIAGRYFSDAHHSATYPRELAREPRVNGGEGMSPGFDPSAWRLKLQAAGTTTQLTLDDIKRLPRTEMTTQLRCIEGWSVVVAWAGCRFSDFVSRYHPSDVEKYVSLKTPDELYYVGLDMKSAVHPQTLLCYEMNGSPLTIEHGAPLRLVTTVKYGIKSIKRIGTITFTNDRPADFWAERGYDWYAGL
jgi:DMSO/TMAO reductase YedYZ molybdopterin-dependent catalytic subunit